MQLNGSGISSTLDTSPLESWTSEASRTSTPATCEASRSAISSQALESGPTPFGLPDGVTIDLFGLAPARANLSPRQALELGLLTSGTSGRYGITSSRSVGLQASLESRFRESVSNLGSTLYKMTWKSWVTPLGRSRSRLAASALRTSENACIGLPTPDSTISQAKPRPPVTAGRKPTDPQISLACIAYWMVAPGQSSGSIAPMDSAAQLNPDYARWLMRIPREWSACAPTAMPSTRKRRASSSKR